MQDFYEYYGNLFNSPDCEVASGKFLPFIHPLEARTVTKSCENSYSENVVTCKSLYRDEFVAEVDGLSLDLHLSSSLPRVPSYIPILDTRTVKMNPSLNNVPFIGVTLRDILSGGITFKAGRMHVSRRIRFRKELVSSFLTGYKVILFLSGSDTLIETVWSDRENVALFETIGEMGFWAVTGFNFSVIGGECAFAQALNLKRSLFSAAMLERNGIKAIPHIYAISGHQIERWKQWFNINPQLRLFTMNCQLQKSRADILQVVRTVSSLLAGRPHLHAILQGFPIRDTILFGTCLSQIHIAESQPIKYAQSHTRIYSPTPQTGVRYEFQHEKPVTEIIAQNIKERKAHLSSIKRKIGR